MKVVINGEPFDWDATRAPMSEALAVEHVYKRRYAEWQEDLAAGSAKAMCVLAWLIWRREGRYVEFADIIDGKVDFDLLEMLTSMAEWAEAEAAAQAEAEAAAEAAAEVPTPAGPGPAGTPGTSPATSASSPKSSATRRRR
jgi:hypothetical protein